MTDTVTLKQQLRDLLPALRRFAISLCGNVADADDLLQSTVERLLSRGIPENADIMPWAFKICRNLWLDDHRARRVRENATQRPELQQQVCADGEDSLAHRLTVAEVEAAMSQLPDDQRTVIALIAVQGLSYKQAATILDVPKGTIMSRLARARLKLAELMGLSQPATGAS